MDLEFLNQLIVDHNLSSAVEADIIRWVRKRNSRFCPDKWRKAMKQRQEKQRILLYGE